MMQFPPRSLNIVLPSAVMSSTVVQALTASVFRVSSGSAAASSVESSGQAEEDITGQEYSVRSVYDFAF